VTTPVAERGRARPRRIGFGQAAIMIGTITVVARAAGFGRQLVFAHTVGPTCLGTAYTTANMVPNIIYDVVLGGALSSVVVPVLAGRIGDASDARRISSALLTWTVLLLAPVSAVVAVASGPLASVLLDGARDCPRSAMDAVGSRMLLVFAPQILLYGLAVVLYGILQSHRRFAAPALAPLVSSVVVVASYAAFGALGGAFTGSRLSSLPLRYELLLSVGTTLGVLALVMTALVPFTRLRLRLRPALRFPPGVAPRVRGLAAAGVLTLLAQDISMVVVVVLANKFGGSGALVLYSFAWAIFVVPYAVLAVPVATTAFPELSAQAASGSAADTTSATASRAVMLASCLGAALLAGASTPVARVFETRAGHHADALALGLVAFAPGLIGYGLSACLSRVLYAHGYTRAPAFTMSLGWLLVIGADLLIVPLVPRAGVVPALGLCTSFGLTLSGIMLVTLVVRVRGREAVAGLPRATACGMAGGAAGTVCGLVVAALVPVRGFGLNVAAALLVCIIAAGAFAAVVAATDGGDLRATVTRMRARSRA
jgi:putative peptidoglycan lipid II flippase